MANSSKTTPIGFRGMPEDKEEWDRWRHLAEQEGIKNFRDWLYPRIRQSLAPKPVAISTINAVDAFRRGQLLGQTVGRLDAVFLKEEENVIAIGWLIRWAQKYPDLAADVVQILTGRPYGLRFHAWWQEVMTNRPSL